MTNPKKYSDLVTDLHSGFEFDIFMDEIERIYSHCENDLEEGSGFITNTMSMNLTKKLRNIGSKIRTQKNIGKKIDMVSEQLSYLVGVVLISVLVSGDSKGLLNKSSKLLGLIKSMRRS